MTNQSITGKVIGGRYRITGLHRAGRMGDIYVGRRIDTDERVSLKLLDPALFGNKEAVKRFERETKITQRLDNPCTLVLNDAGQTEDGLPYMVLEYVDGEQLSDLLEAGPLAPERAAYIAAQIAMALSEAHSIGVVHRDLSPEIVLITEDAGQKDAVKVLDFGLSRLQEGPEEENSALTAVGVRIGTPTYMAPEYIESHALDHRADLYALGILLFEMITGEPPFTGRPYKLMDKHLSEIPPRLSTVAAGVPPWLDELVARLLEKRPEDRVQTADEVIATIERGLGTRLHTVQTHSTVAPEAAPQVPRTQAPRRAQPREAARPARAPTPDQDPILTQFIRAQVLQHGQAARAPDPKNSFVVGQVSSTGIAAALGVRRGWHVEIPELMPGNQMVDTSVLLQPTERRRYLLASPDGSVKLDVTTTGAEPGMDLVRSSLHVRQFYTPTQNDPEPLLDVWRQADWDTLEKLSWRTLTQQRGSAGMLNTGLFARFMGGGGIKLREHPALLLYGAAQIETGKVEEGLELVTEYREHYALHWGPEYDAIAHFYLAFAAAKRGDRDEALDLLVQAWVRWRSPRFADKIAEMTGSRPDTRVWYGRQFPDYRLDEANGRRAVNLRDVLARMRDPQLLLVCMMGGFRGNAEYDRFMRRYLYFNAHFSPFLSALHVVTHRTLRDDDRPEHYQGEDLVLASNLDFMVLEDYRAFVQRAVKPPQIPTIYGIDPAGWVVYEGRLDAVGLWEMLATAAQVRLQRA